MKKVWRKVKGLNFVKFEINEVIEAYIEVEGAIALERSTS